MPVPEDARVFWRGTAASIPANWSRDTACDTDFLQGDDETYTAASESGGTHTHTTDPHTHTGIPHTHTFSGGSRSGSGVWVSDDPPGMNIPAHPDHGHNSETSYSATITYQTTVVTLATTNAQPPYAKAIWIGPDDANQDIPDGAGCFADTTDVLSEGFDKLDGTGGLPDWDGKYVLGADAAGDGGATGGTTTHTHTATTHTHTDDAHSHAAKLCGTATATSVGEPDGLQRLPSQHHTVELTSQAFGGVSSDVITVNTASNDPAYIELLGVENTSGSAALAAGCVLPFFDDPDNLPDEWSLCDGSGDSLDCCDRQVRITTTNGNIGNTGGADSHQHTTVSHGHTQSQHKHGTTVNSSGTLFLAAGLDDEVMSWLDAHTHKWTISNTVPTMQSATVTMQNSDKRCAYRTCVWIRYDGPAFRLVTGTRPVVMRDARIITVGN
jgi:hypothetical protein